MKFDKTEIRNLLTVDDVFELLIEFGGEPEMTSFGIISSTICHNPKGTGSRKLYYYSANKMFHCYSGCSNPSFDIFELVIKVMKIQLDQEYDLNQAIRYIAYKFGVIGEQEDEGPKLEDWDYFETHEDEYKNLGDENKSVLLKEYDKSILRNFNYSAIIQPWLDDGISNEALKYGQIGFYPGGDQIMIPHFDKDNRLVGIRGRSLCKQDAELYGKYRPIRIENKYYSHPLGMNLYNLNNSKGNIKRIGKAIIFESEKSTLQFVTQNGIENDITVACCGSNISSYQIKLLIDAGAKEIVIAFDRQFQEIGNEEYKTWVNKLTRINNRFKNQVLISIIFDKNLITDYKDSPTDKGKEIFMKLFKERIVL